MADVLIAVICAGNGASFTRVRSVALLLAFASFCRLFSFSRSAAAHILNYVGQMARLM